MRTVFLAVACGANALAQTGVPSEKEMREVHKFVEETRELKFDKPVPAGSKTIAQVRDLYRFALAFTVPKERLAGDAMMFAKFGVVPENTDLAATYLDILGFGVHAYYDPRERKLFVVDRSGARDGTMTSMLAEMLLAANDSRMDLIFVAHELTHALQDQHFKYFARTAAIADEDGALAARCLSEGDANLVLYEWVAHLGGKSAEDMFRATGNQAFESALPIGVAGVDRQPVFLREQFLFPYAGGVAFVRELRAKGGWEAVNRAYEDFPASTEQILHPERYLGERDVPVSVKLPDPGDLLAGWTPVRSGVLGEFGCRAMMRAIAPGIGDAARNAACAGWDGDTWAVWEREGKVLLVWASTWDSEAEAEEFRHTELRALRERHGLGKPPKKWKAGDPESFPLKEGGRVAVIRSGADVVVVDGLGDGSEDLAKQVLAGLTREERK